MRTAITIIWLCILGSGIASFFWYNELIYSLPTPLPANYNNVPVGATIQTSWSSTFSDGKPVFLHFFNTECPCSRFNIPHFKSLLKQYGDSVHFAIVPMGAEAIDTERIREIFGPNVTILTEEGIAERCGVYSTPQAVIIGTDKKLFFRGNYNQTRYCSNKKTEYARLALQNVLQGSIIPAFDLIAFKAYGCKLPICNK